MNPQSTTGIEAGPITIAEVEVGAEIVRVELRLYNGRPMFSAWRFYRDKAGDLRPGRHGLACSVERLPEVAAAFSGTPAERYLREVRCYGGVIPATIGFLPARGDHSPAMISAFGMPFEIEPNVISIMTTAVMAVHLTRLALDGSAKAGTGADKIMIGTPRGAPIALATVGDLLGLAITEGIEDGLSVHEATGLGVWAAGSAAFMPGLATAIPSYVDCTTIVADPDPDGEKFAAELKARLAERHLDHRMIVWGRTRSIAA